MSVKGRNRFDPDRVAVLDDELTFALRSLDDLEQEHAAGHLSDEQFERLRADYTVRAAEAVRSQRREVGRRTTAAPRSRRNRTAVAGAVVLAAALVLVAVGHGSKPRAPGQTITGNNAAATSPSIGGQDARAHDAKAEDLLTGGDLAGALREYLAAISIDRRDTEALTYAGWISFLGGEPTKALPFLDAAVASDPRYPDAHAFRGIVLFRGSHDRTAAAAELRTYLRLVPRGQMSGQVRAVLASIESRRP